jgi:hypothetical protein
MNTKSTISELPTLELPAELTEMQEAIDGLSTETKLLLQPLFQRVLESTNRRRKILQMVQESIGQLRLDMKYLVFDLEATRRERDELQRQASDFSDEEFFGAIAAMGEEFTKDTQLRKMNGNRGSKHFLYINRTFFGLYNLMHDLKARVMTQNYLQFIPKG